MDVLIRFAIATAAGAAFAIGPPVAQLAAIALFPLASRVPHGQSMMLCLAYAAVAALPALEAAWHASGSLAWSFGVYAVPVGLYVALVGAALAVPARWRPVSLVLAIVALSIPPLGTVSLLSPLSLAGVLFPGLGDLGLVLLLVGIGAMTLSGRGLRATLVSGTLFVGAANASAPSSEHATLGFDTARGVPSTIEAAMLRSFFRHEELDRIETSRADRVLLPESAFGVWQAEDGAVFERTSAVVIGGARLPLTDDRVVNTLVDGRSGEVLYAQRFPLPVVPGEVHAAVSGRDAGLVRGPLSALLCIEIANPWAAWTTARRSASELLWAANLGWSRSAWLETRLRANVGHWARLYALEPIAAVNRHG